MQITDLDVFLVDGSFGGVIGRNYVLVVVKTDEGIYGVGEGTTWPGGDIVKSAMEYIKPLLIGANPFEIERIWNDTYRRMSHTGTAGFFISALSGIEIALWDIVGKALNTPVYNLIGGPVRKRIPLYANYWTQDLAQDPSAYAERAAEVKEKGFAALKFDPFKGYHRGEPVGPILKKAAKLLEAVRNAVGPEMGIAIECAAQFDSNSVMDVVQMVKEYNPLWLEEPLPFENIDAMARLKARISIPIATGERLLTRYGFRDLIEKQAADIIQPDIARTGGLFEIKKIAGLAETYYIPVSPHNPNGPVANAASVHAMATVPNFLILEYMYRDMPWRNTVVTPAFKVVNGCIKLPDGPGLGIEFDEEEARRHPRLQELPIQA